eukprot:5111405-Pleurochrysis_carterae.AAC.1
MQLRPSSSACRRTDAPWRLSTARASPPSILQQFCAPQHQFCVTLPAIMVAPLVMTHCFYRLLSAAVADSDEKS